MSLVAPIVTRGFGEGVHGGAIVTRGYGGGLFVQVLDFLRLAGRRAKEFVPEILYVVKASLEEVNKDILVYPITKTLRKAITPSKEEVIKGKATLMSTQGIERRNKIFITAEQVSVRSGRQLISEDTDE
mgnify:FL=1